MSDCSSLIVLDRSYIFEGGDPFLKEAVSVFPAHRCIHWSRATRTLEYFQSLEIGDFINSLPGNDDPAFGDAIRHKSWNDVFLGLSEKTVQWQAPVNADVSHLPSTTFFCSFLALGLDTQRPLRVLLDLGR